MKKRKKKPVKPTNFNKLIIALLVVIVAAAFLLFTKNGGKASSISCSPAPEGCEYQSDDRVSQGELIYPCGILSCSDYTINCVQGQENTETIQEGRAKVVTGLPIQVGGISNITTGLYATVVFGNGGFWSVYEGSLPYKTPRYFTMGNQLYSIEPLSLSKDSLTVKVFCGKK